MEMKVILIVAMAVFFGLAEAGSLKRRLNFHQHMRRVSRRNAGRIVGGEEATKGEFKDIVDIKVVTLGPFGYIGAGVILDENRVVTTATVMFGQDIADIVLIAGDFDRSIDENTEQVLTPISYLRHPDFNPFTFVNDIGILYLSAPFELNTNVAAANLPSANTEPAESSCTVAGWGNISPDETPFRLHKAVMPLVSDPDCLDMYSGVNIVVDSMICFGESGKDTCQGDSGSPIYCGSGNVLTGLSSWDGEGCTGTTPAVFTQVSHFVDWIEANKP